MSEIILHHYAISPFSEKVRRVLAYKAIPWRAVEQPIMAPKPDLTPLTGGYRRIPVMQIGADIYCDTALIIRRLDELFSERPVTVGADAGLAAVIEDWADHRVFMHVVPPVVSALADALPEGFFEDRGAMSPGFDKEALIGAAPLALEQTKQDLNYLDQQLAQHTFLLGEEFSIADAACFHVVNFLLNDPSNEALIKDRPALDQWVNTVKGFGEGNVQEMAPADALSIARDAAPEDIDGPSVSARSYACGDKVTVVADDYGVETSVGEVVRIGENEIVITRDDDTVGVVAVHYPRAGYRIEKS
ncbi:MAG: glutathione S-transferase family protein [Pseudomonadota bacterium]